MSEPETDYEKQRKAVVVNMWMYVGADYTPTPLEFVVHALGFDPSQDGLYLCGQCGITCAHKCSYGGWHDESQGLNVTLSNREDRP